MYRIANYLHIHFSINNPFAAHKLLKLIDQTMIPLTFQNVEYIVHSLAREYGSECLGTWNKVFTDLYPNLGSNWTHGDGNETTAITPYRMGQGADFFWTAIFSVMLVIAICGNLVVFWIVIGKLIFSHL